MISNKNLSSEVKLDVDISKKPEKPIPVSSSKAIFLTGATGFLGSFLLNQLLHKSDANIYCLTRAANAKEGKSRLINSQQSYDLQILKLSDRVIPVIGDLGNPQLGMQPEEYDDLTAYVDTVYHCGARLNFLSSYPVLKSENVNGTREVIRFAAHKKIKTLHYISSTAIFESPEYAEKTVYESDLKISTRDMVMGYSQSKWVAEQIVLLAKKHGLPTNIYRLPFIAGHSKTGICNSSDFVCRMVIGCVQAGYAPNLNFSIDLSPVDYISRAIHYLSNDLRHLNNVYHLNNPNPMRWEILSQRIKDHGYPLISIPYEEWQHRICNMDKKARLQNAIYPLLPFVMRKWHKEQLTLLELYQHHNKPYIDCKKTIKALENSSIICPTADSNLVDTYLAYWKKIGIV